MLEEVGSFLVKEERNAGGAENSLPLFCLDFFFFFSQCSVICLLFCLHVSVEFCCYCFAADNNILISKIIKERILSTLYVGPEGSEFNRSLGKQACNQSLLHIW